MVDYSRSDGVVGQRHQKLRDGQFEDSTSQLLSKALVIRNPAGVIG